MEMNNDIFTPDLPIPEPVSFEDAPIPTPVEEETPAAAPPPRRRRKADAPVLTIESGDEIETEDAREAAAWHEIHNAYRTRRILSAPLGGIEQTDSGKTIAVVDYNGFRIVIPLKEMMVMPNAANSTESMVVRQMKLLGNMLGAEIDFVILGIDSKTRSVVASRREAMMRKRQLFYFSPDANGEYRVREGRVVQARVIAVADKSIRVEIFGVECSIITAALRTAGSNITWEWATKDPLAIVKEGGRCLIRVHGLDGFESAEVVLDKQAHLRCELINTVPLRPSPTADAPEKPRIPAETPPLPDPRIWYETEGRTALEGIVADLSSRGHHSMTVQEDGHIHLTDGSTSVLPALHGFPPVGCWEKLKQVFAGDGLAAEEISGKLVLSW